MIILSNSLNLYIMKDVWMVRLVILELFWMMLGIEIYLLSGDSSDFLHKSLYTLFFTIIIR
jgi:hypothetical protein